MFVELLHLTVITANHQKNSLMRSFPEFSFRNFNVSRINTFKVSNTLYRFIWLPISLLAGGHIRFYRQIKNLTAKLVLLSIFRREFSDVKLK